MRRKVRPRRVVFVRVFDAGRSRSIYKHVNSGGSFGASSVRRQLIGLGKAERIDAVEISWPGSDALETRTGVALDSVLRVKQR